MDKAKITKSGGFDCAPDGHTVVNYPVGEVVTGAIAVWALDAKAAQRMFDPVKERKVLPALEAKAPNRARKGRGK